MTDERLAELERLADAAHTAVPELVAEVRRLRGAVAAERERCAGIAELPIWRDGGWMGLHREGMSDAAEGIAARIRSGDQP